MSALRHFTEIYHHDLRCKNVFLMKNLEPKLGNFERARLIKDPSTKIDDAIKVVNWLAPERMINKNTSYNSKCEIFRYIVHLVKCFLVLFFIYQIINKSFIL